MFKNINYLQLYEYVKYFQESNSSLAKKAAQPFCKYLTGEMGGLMEFVPQLYST